MTFGGTKATALLFIGDIVVFICSLWLTLLVRYQELPTPDRIITHLVSFAPLFVLWLLVFYIAGLYSKRVVLFAKELPGTILRTQVLNIILAALYFFIVPIGIAPKTNLILYLGISVFAVFAWRLWLFRRISKPSGRERAAVIGAGPEIEDLAREMNSNTRYHFSIPLIIHPEEITSDAALVERLAAESLSAIIVDVENDSLRPMLARLYELSFVSPGYQFYDFYQIYEEVFDRVPLSLLQYDWFLMNVSSSASNFYDFFKRAIDIVGGVAMGLVTLVVLPFVFIAMRIEGPGPIFLSQKRLGMYGTRINAYKFRSMRYSDAGAWKGEGENYVTKVGAFLRLTSLDEFPQFMNILRGEISLIGPRNDIEPLGMRLGEAIPYYNIRYIVKPGITGWAQINQQYEQGNISPQSIEETKTRLAYDFYYIKHRSLALDIVIALKTMKRMFFRVSSW